MSAVKKSSPLWKHYKDTGDFHFAECLYCAKQVSRGKGDRKVCGNKGMIVHLRTHHPGMANQVDVERAELVAAATAAVIDTKDETTRGPIPIFNLKRQDQRQAYLKRIFPDGPRTFSTIERMNHDNDWGILSMLIMDLEPFAFVNRPGFLTYSYLSEPRYTVRSDHYYRSLLEKAYDKGLEVVKRKIEHDAPSVSAFQLDAWTAQHTGYMGGILTYINGDWKREAILLACSRFDDRHTAANMAEWIQTTLADFRCQYCTSVITVDTAANNLAMWGIEGFKDLYQCGKCVNHRLQLSIKDEIFAQASIKNVIDVCRSVCTFANQSNNFVHDLLEIQRKVDPDCTPVGLVQDVPTRWNSTYAMLQRFLRLKEHLITLMEVPEWNSKIHTRLRSGDWDLVEKVIVVLKVFFEVTEQFSHASACISEVIPNVAIILRALDRSDGDYGVIGWKGRLKESVLARLGSVEKEQIYSVATLLDPRFKDQFFRCEADLETAKSDLIALVEAERDQDDDVNLEERDEQVVQENEEEASCSVVHQLKKKIRLESKHKKQAQTAAASVATVRSVVEAYLAEPEEELECLRYWAKVEANSAGCKIKEALLRVVRRFLTPPPTSTNVERLFSYAGLVATDQRASLSPERLHKILFLRENLVMLNFKLSW